MRFTPAVALVAVSMALALSACGSDDVTPPDLAYVSARNGVYAVYTMAADGRGQHRLTEGDDDPSTPEGLFFQFEPAWSPDGTRIAFTSARSGTFDVYVMNADGSGTQRITRMAKDERHPTWSPDGERIAFAHSDDLFVMNADGRGADRISGSGASESDPSWSPDGDWIAYSRRPQGSETREIWVVRPDGSDPHPVTTLGARSVNPAWSTDSSRLAFASDRAGGLFDIYVVTVRGKNVRRLTREGPSAFEPSWSPDDSSIAFAQDGSIRTVDLDENVDELTSAEDNDSFPAWNPQPAPSE
jgi:Tol biopolymer transport system component